MECCKAQSVSFVKGDVMQSERNLIAKATVLIRADRAKIWDALTNPAQLRKYMFGAEVESEWKPGSAITWKGMWQGKPYEDKGKVLEIIPGEKIRYTHFSPLSGEADAPENYHTVTVTLQQEGDAVRVSLSQDGNTTDEEKIHSEKNWQMMLENLEKLFTP